MQLSEEQERRAATLLHNLHCPSECGQFTPEELATVQEIRRMSMRHKVTLRHMGQGVNTWQAECSQCGVLDVELSITQGQTLRDTHERNHANGSAFT